MKNKDEHIKASSDSRKSFLWIFSNSQRLFSAIILIIFISIHLFGQERGNTARQSLSLEVKPIAKISVAGTPSPLVIDDAIAGSSQLSITDNNCKYSLVTNIDNMKIVASINNQMPSGTKLLIKLTSSKATSVGNVDISNATVPVDVVTGIRKGSDADQLISYTFAADAETENIPSQSRTITLTLTN